MGEPPQFKGVKNDRRKLTLYISSLKTWAKVGGVPKKDQADTVFYHASLHCMDYYEELELKFGDTLSEKEDGLNSIITYLQTKYGVSQHTEIVRKLSLFYHCKREKGENLVDFVGRFEAAYKDCERLTVAENRAIIQYTDTALAVRLMTSCNFSDVDLQIVSKGLEFEAKTEAEEKKLWEQAKKAIINHQITKQSNQVTVSTTTQQSHSKALQTYLLDKFNEDTAEKGEELMEAFETFVAEQRKDKRKFDKKKDRKMWKCDYCICDHPKWKACGCPCNFHSKDKCPNPDPEKKKLADSRAVTATRKARSEKNEGTGAPSFLVNPAAQALPTLV